MFLAAIRPAIMVPLIGTILLSSAGLAQSASSSSVAEAQHRLLQLKVAGMIVTDVPADVRKGISELKKALAVQTDAVVSQLPSTATIATVKQGLASAMPLPSVGKESNEHWGALVQSDIDQPVAGLYGGELSISVKKPKPSLLLVRETFDISCGSDNVLLVYSNAGGSWKRILLWQSKPYTNIGDAFGDTYETLPLQPEHEGYPLLLVLHGTPWCTSVMSGFAMDILELRSSSDPILFWHGEHGYRRDDGPPLTLHTTRDGFEVRTSVSTTGERVTRKGTPYALVSRTGVMRYVVAAAGVHRVEPIAMNARDSVEEWLRMPRTEAAEFADGPSGSLTWTMFQEFTYRGKPSDASGPYPGVGEVQVCKDDPAHFQAHVMSEIFDPAVKGSRAGPSYFVQLRQVSNGYRIHEVTRTKDLHCSGADLMDANELARREAKTVSKPGRNVDPFANDRKIGTK